MSYFVSFMNILKILGKKMVELLKLFLDIEVANPPNKFPFADQAAHPIISITTYNTYTKTYHTYFVASDHNLKSKDPIWQISVFNTERAMLVFFKREFERIDPDLILAWNIEFDYLYIQNRLKNLEIDPLENRFQILDLLGAYKQIKKGGVSSYNLKNVERLEGIKRKLPESIAKDITELYDAGQFRHILLYNKEDVSGIVKIDQKVRITDFYIGLREAIGIESYAKEESKDGKIQRLNWHIFHNSVLIDTFMFHMLKQKIILPTKVKVEKKGFEGGVVLKPEAGLYKNVANLDMSKFYPSIILSLNISPEVNEKNKDRKGLIPQLIENLVKERTKIESERSEYKVNSEEYRILTDKRQIIKDLINSIYGYICFVGSRLYSEGEGAKVTGTGRKGLYYAKEQSEALGFKVIYGDTDGIFCKVPDDMTHEEISDVADEITQRFDEFFKQLDAKTDNHYFKLDYDMFYSKLLMLTKKRYAGLVTFEGGKETNYIKMRGIETRRGNAPELTKNLQEKVLELIFGDKTDEIKPLVDRIKNKIMGTTITESDFAFLDTIAIPTGLQQSLKSYGGLDKNGNRKGILPHVRAAVIANEILGKNYGAGSKIKTLYIHPLQLPKMVELPSGEKIERTDVVGYEDVSEINKYINIAKKNGNELELDKKRMSEVVVSDKIQPILDVIGSEKVQQQTLF